MTDLLVVGSGPGGVAAALTAARLGARVTLVERSGLGGTCVHAGCIPSGALHRTVTVLDEVLGASRVGVEVGAARVNWDRMQAWSGSVVQSAAHLTRVSLEAARIEVLATTARFTGPRSVQAAGRLFERTPVVLATGAMTMLHQPASNGGRRVLSSEDAMALAGAPDRLLVSGAARFSIEWADFFHHLGTTVTVSAPDERILPDEDADIAGLLQLLLEERGIRFLLGSAGIEETDVDAVLVADERAPNLANLDLDATGAMTAAGGEIAIDTRCQTSVPGIYAAGDVTGPPWLSNRARAQGVVAATNALGGSARFRPERIPRSVNTHPELAAVGLTEAQATAGGGQVAVGIGEMVTSLRGITRGEARGALKLVVDPEFGEILGGHMIGAGATEVIAQVAAAMELEADYHELGRVQHLHPSLAELVTDAIASI
jgi:dihydrolipoamide dehydrogenase